MNVEHNQLRAGQRAVQGAAEGALVGLAVVVLRVGWEMVRGARLTPGSIADLGVWAVWSVAAAVYVFAVGRAACGRVAGSLAGAFLGGVAGVLIAVLRTLDATPPAPADQLLVALALGLLVGAPLGALAERLLAGNGEPPGEP